MLIGDESSKGPVETNRRVGIVTINDDNNFGNRLQAYALQRAVARLGWQPELIRNTPSPMSTRLLATRAWHAVRGDGVLAFGGRNGRLLWSKSRGSHGPVVPRYAPIRRSVIANFARANLVSSDVEFAERPVEEWADRYQRVIVGSDQVWNHGFRNAQEIDFLTFASPEQRIAYAASFGVHDVPEYLRRNYRAWISGIPHISVREQRGAEIVADLTGRRVPVVVDPTLLLSREDWESFQRVPATLRTRNYAVQFFLGRPTDAQLAWVTAQARERGLALMDLNDLNSSEFAHLDPEGFVAALANAQFVATDSFHAGVFSLLHHTPVAVRRRDETASRLETLFAKHEIALEDTDVPGLRTAPAPDWCKADQLLRLERDASWSYLRDALGPIAEGG